MKSYTVNTLGCYADGSYGDAHVTTVILRMLEAESAPEELIQALRDTNNDDDAHGDAIEWLNDNACAYPAQFEFEAGDLVLVNVEAEERS